MSTVAEVGVDPPRSVLRSHPGRHELRTPPSAPGLAARPEAPELGAYSGAPGSRSWSGVSAPARIEADLHLAWRLGQDLAATAHDEPDLALGLYRTWYAPSVPVTAPEPTAPPLAGRYRLAHAGCRTWHTHTVTEVGPGGLARTVDDEERSHEVLRGQYTHSSSRRALGPQPGEHVQVRGAHCFSDGAWWYTWGGPGRFGPGGTDGDGLRLFLAARDGRVVDLVASLTGMLADFEHAWTLKSTVRSDVLGRPNATVLYLPLDAAADLHALLGRASPTLEPLLRAHHPALTLPVGRGMSLAQSPPGTESFGEQRCRVVAAALRQAPTGQRPTLRAITLALADAGIDPQRPYRRARTVSTWDAPWL